MQHNKLVRDRIPEIISQTGKEFTTVTLKLEEYKKALIAKLDEEWQEFREAIDPQHRIEELADVLEVLDAMGEASVDVGDHREQVSKEISALGASPEVVAATQASKALERGRFLNRIWLVEVAD